MTPEQLLTILKIDLQISSTALDSYLSALLDEAQTLIQREGLTIGEEDSMLIEWYAAFLYRHRRDNEAKMPRYLRYALNNAILAQKAGGANG